MSGSVVKKRNWGFIMYPDSAPSDWRDILTRTGLPIAVSPLHDRDANADGEQKKPHWHVLACYSGPTSSNVVQGIANSVHATNVMPIESVRGNFRYFTHEDNPEKASYDKADIITLNGFNIIDYVEYTHSEVANLKKRVHHLILDKDFMEYSDLMDYLLSEDLSDEYFIASNNTIFFDRIITSRRHKRDRLCPDEVTHILLDSIEPLPED